MQNCHSILQKLDAYTSNYLKSNYKQGGFKEIFLDDAGLSLDEQKGLYHHYIHNSLNAKLGNFTANTGIRSQQSNPPKRAEIKDDV